MTRAELRRLLERMQVSVDGGLSKEDLFGFVVGRLEQLQQRRGNTSQVGSVASSGNTPASSSSAFSVRPSEASRARQATVPRIPPPELMPGGYTRRSLEELHMKAQRDCNSFLTRPFLRVPPPEDPDFPPLEPEGTAPGSLEAEPSSEVSEIRPCTSESRALHHDGKEHGLQVADAGVDPVFVLRKDDDEPELTPEETEAWVEEQLKKIKARKMQEELEEAARRRFLEEARQQREAEEQLLRRRRAEESAKKHAELEEKRRAAQALREERRMERQERHLADQERRRLEKEERLTREYEAFLVKAANERARQLQWEAEQEIQQELERKRKLEEEARKKEQEEAEERMRKQMQQREQIQAQQKSLLEAQKKKKEAEKKAAQRRLAELKKQAEEEEERLRSEELKQKEEAEVIEAHPSKQEVTKTRRALAPESTSPLSHVHVVILGPEGVGKSELYGALCRAAGLWNDRDLAKHRKELPCDDLRRSERGTIVQEPSSPMAFSLIDVPGSRKSLPKAVQAAAEADVALLVVSAKGKELESALKDSAASRGSLHEHLRIAAGLGANKAVVAVTKMSEVKWAQDRFDAAVDELGPLLLQAGFAEECTVFVPVDGASADLDGKMAPWYSGGSLLCSLSRLARICPSREGPLQLQVLEIVRTATDGLTATGRVVRGRARAGLLCSLGPSKLPCLLESVSIAGKAVQEAPCGEAAELRLRPGEGPCTLDFSSDTLALAPSGALLMEASAALPAFSQIKASLDVLEMPRPFTVGFKAVLHLHTATVEAEVVKILEALDTATGVLTERPKLVRPGQRVTVLLDLAREVAAEASEDRLGKLLFRFEETTIARGWVLEGYTRK